MKRLFPFSCKTGFLTSRFLIPMVLSAIMFSLGENAMAQEKVTGEYTYYAQEYQTFEQAKILAWQSARAAAIANKFGTHVTAISSNLTSEGMTHFVQMSDNEVNGVWIKDLEAPKFERLLWDEGFAIKCTVKGLARELKSSQINLDTHIYCNGFEPNHEQLSFRDNDHLYLSTLSPTDGYLTVYLMDTEQMVYSLLPYYNQGKGFYEIKANTEYRFFSEKEARGTMDEAYAESVRMGTEHDIEQNILFVIFSPNKYYKAPDHDHPGEGEQFRSLSYEEFNKWLGKCYSRDKELTVSRYVLDIRK